MAKKRNESETVQMQASRNKSLSTLTCYHLGSTRYSLADGKMLKRDYMYSVYEHFTGLQIMASQAGVMFSSQTCFCSDGTHFWPVKLQES